MTKNRFYALVFGYYLSRFDIKGYKALGFDSFNKAYSWGAEIFKDKVNSIKNIRDEFDPHFSNPRKGFHQRPMRPSRNKIYNLFKDMDFDEMQDLFKDIMKYGKSTRIDSLYVEVENTNDEDNNIEEDKKILLGEVMIEINEELKPLKKLEEDIYNKYIVKCENNIAYDKIVLKETFIKRYKEISPDKIEFGKEIALVSRTSSKKVYVPKLYFIMACFAMTVKKELDKYKKYAIDIIKSAIEDNKDEIKQLVQDDKNKNSKKTIIVTDADILEKVGEYLRDDDNKSANVVTKIRERINLDIESLQTLESNKKLIKDFVFDYKSWLGAKSIGRTDYYYSPIQATFHLVNDSATYFNFIVDKFAENPDWENVNNVLEMIDEEVYTKKTIIPKNVVRQKGGLNLIVYGAPGTGKSYYIEENYKQNITRVVFHPEYTYFDFVGNYRPVPVYKETAEQFINLDKTIFGSGEPHIDYRFVTGPFIDIFIKAWQEPDQMHTLIIEELNRADAAAVFGSIFQLLDRDKNGTSEYAIDPSEELRAELINQGLEECIKDGLRIPSNMNIVATMNSADQGVNFMDTAFKRRWKFEYLEINIADAEHKDDKIQYANSKITWGTFVESINEKLTNLNIQEDRLVGPYFVGPEELRADSKTAIKKVLFYLWDDVLRHKNRDEVFKNVKNMAELMNDFTQKDVLDIMDDASDEK